MRLGAKLIFPVLLTAACAIVSGALYGVLNQRAQADAETVRSGGTERLQTLERARTQLIVVRADVLRTLAIDTPTDDSGTKDRRSALAEQVEGIERVMTMVIGGVPDDQTRQLLQAAAPVFKTYLAHCDQAIAHSATDRGAAAAAMRQAEQSFETLSQSLDALAERSEQLREGHAQEAESRARILAVLLALALLATTLGALFVAWRMQRGVVHRIRQAVALSREVASGKLSVAPQVQGDDEIAELLLAQAQMVQGLRHSMATVRAATDHIGQASEQISGHSSRLHERTDETSGALRQTAVSMTELSETVGHTAASARHADTLAASAAQVAQRGGEVVGQVVTTMSEINASSRRIGDIIGTIDSIAFQTNILALNAAVEAARAGEQGRGFAVVASEVRLLAQRSATAAREIKTLINSSVERVDVGARLVADAGQTMNEIVASVQQVSRIVGEISAAADGQSIGIKQVNDAVAQLGDATQQNTVMVQHSSQAADGLAQQSSKLAEVVGRFVIEESVARAEGVEA